MDKHTKTLAALMLLVFSTSSVGVYADTPSPAEATMEVTPFTAPTSGLSTAPDPSPPRVAEAASFEGRTDDDPRETFVLGAVLCFNEASGNPFDCRAILHIRMRSARGNGRTLREELLALHSERRPRHPEVAALRSYRATNPHPDDGRPWLGDIRSDLHQPLGWTGTAEEWERTARGFARLFELVKDTIEGRATDPCLGRARRWGGRVLDHEHIVRNIQQGELPVYCGVTANVYLGPAPR